MQKETVMATKTESTKLLVICVDRDNDVGEKTGLETPVVGRNACIEAAQKLALEDPEDADSNAIFSAIKTYEDLSQLHHLHILVHIFCLYDCIICVITFANFYKP